MKFICSKIRNSYGYISFIVYDTMSKKINQIDYDTVFKNLKDYYGIEKKKNELIFVGYRFMPFIDKLIDENQQLDFYKYYIVVSKFIQKKNKFYLLIRSDGKQFRYSEKDAINLNNMGRIINTIQNVSYIKLKQGSLPIFTRIRENRDVNDTVLKLKDLKDLKTVMTTVGVGRKFLGKRLKDSKIGMVKSSVSPFLYDNINEVLCFELGKLFNIPICEASFETYHKNNNLVISLYEYDYNKENIVSCKKLFGATNFHKRFTMSNLEKYVSKEAVEDFNKMVIFDLITNQHDRHINNFSFFKGKLYPLYDNGRCLFWDVSNLEKIKDEDLVSTFYTNEHGYGWSYIDGVLGIEECRRLINCNVTYKEIESIVKKYYNEKRAKILSSYMYRVYKLIIGGDLNVG